MDRTYSTEEALAEAGATNPEFQCNGQFAVIREHVLCFFTVGPHLELRSPERIEWTSTDKDSPSDLVCNVYQWSQGLPVNFGPGAFSPEFLENTRSADHKRKLRQHEIFLRSLPTGRFIYAGDAHLGSYGGGKGAFSMGFTLGQKLPREIWLELGGYSEWSVEINHKEECRLSRRELERFIQLCGKAMKNKFAHIVLNRYEGDALHLYTNDVRGWLMYLRQPDDSGIYLHADGIPEQTEEFRCTCGISLNFPQHQTVDKAEAMRIAEHFFSHGSLPTTYIWSEI